MSSNRQIADLLGNKLRSEKPEMKLEYLLTLLSIPLEERQETDFKKIKNFFEEKLTLKRFKAEKAQELDSESINECFSNHLEIRFLKAEENLFFVDDPADKLYLILKGNVDVLIPERKNVLISKLEYFKYLEKLFYEKEINLVKIIINDNLVFALKALEEASLKKANGNYSGLKSESPRKFFYQSFRTMKNLQNKELKKNNDNNNSNSARKELQNKFPLMNYNSLIAFNSESLDKNNVINTNNLNNINSEKDPNALNNNNNNNKENNKGIVSLSKNPNFPDAAGLEKTENKLSNKTSSKEITNFDSSKGSGAAKSKTDEKSKLNFFNELTIEEFESYEDFLQYCKIKYKQELSKKIFELETQAELVDLYEKEQEKILKFLDLNVKFEDLDFFTKENPQLLQLLLKNNKNNQKTRNRNASKKIYLDSKEKREVRSGDNSHIDSSFSSQRSNGNICLHSKFTPAAKDFNGKLIFNSIIYLMNEMIN